MAGAGNFVFINYTGNPDVDDKQSMRSVRQHIMQDFFRREREADNNTAIERVVTPDSPFEKQMKKPRRREPNTQMTSQTQSKRSIMSLPLRAHNHNLKSTVCPPNPSNDIAILQGPPQRKSVSWESVYRDVVRESDPSDSALDDLPSLDHISDSSFESSHSLDPCGSPGVPRSIDSTNSVTTPFDDGVWLADWTSNIEGMEVFYARPVGDDDQQVDSHSTRETSKTFGDPDSDARNTRTYSSDDHLGDNESALVCDQLRRSRLSQYNVANCVKPIVSDIGDREQKQSDRGDSKDLSDVNSTTSSEESMIDVDDPLLDSEVSELRSWLLEQAQSELFCQHLQQKLMPGEYISSTSQERSTDSSPQQNCLSACSSFSSTSSKVATSCRNPCGKRGNNDANDEDKDPNKRRSIFKDKSILMSTTRLACLFNKHDPMMYRSNAQTNNKFEICGTHDFQDMNKLCEHLKRVHSDQPLQCPRCTSTSFGSSEELQAHQTTSEPCTLVSLNAVKRIQWITHDKRKALQAAVNRCLRSCTNEEKWRYAYRWLFPDTDPDETPCPYLQDPVVSIVSSVVDDFEIRLRELISSSTDLNDLEGRITTIRGQFLAQYGINTREFEEEPPSLTSLRTVSSSPGSGRLTTTPPLDAADLNQLHPGDDTNHIRPATSSNSQPDPNVLPPRVNAYEDVAFDLHVPNDPVWPQNDGSSNFGNGMLSWDPSGIWNIDHVTTNDIRNSLYVMDSSKNVHGSDALVQQESLNYS